jgi:transcriptional regulator GlxA family with amidase domain
MNLIQDDLKIVTQVAARLKKEYKQSHTHESLASDNFINDRKLRTIFKLITGKTINDFLTEVRMEKTREYLSTTDEPIKRIAVHVGLDIRTLEKHFKRSTGMTPLTWRQESRMQAIDSSRSAFNQK